MLLMVDNYDSFTFNLVQYLGALGCDVDVRRNDAVTVDDVARLAPTHIVISPGPGRPDDAGVSLALIERFAGHIPILGVCLGHQAIGQAYGAKVIHARSVMHGKTSVVRHDGRGAFEGLPPRFTATRYHSLVVDEATMPDCLEISAWSDGEAPEVMGVRHRELAVEGVQFHPEAILTEHGKRLLGNFLRGGRGRG